MMNDTMPVVTLPRPVANAVLQHAQSGGRDEVCGLIAARQGMASRSYPIPNIAADPQRRYLMDPASQISALRDMRARTEDLFAIYHSHPNGPAEPSSIDIREAAYPEALYLIISLNTKGVLEIRGFRLQQGQAREVSLRIA